jgi:WD40 repeat protein/nucleoside phosphorylase
MADVTPNINQTRAMRIAVNRIQGFAKQFGEAHRNLARHAAFPFLLTPDLLYQISENFVPEAPLTAVDDVLLSRLCRQVGYEIYEMDIADRNLLLRELKEQFGQERLNALGKFLLDYVAQRRDDPDTDNDLAEAQEWTALAYTKSTEAARKLVEALSLRVKQQNMTEIFRLTSLVETLAEPLVEAGFEPLLVYSDGLKSFVRGNDTDAAEQLRNLFEGNDFVEIAGVNASIPPELRRTQKLRLSSNNKLFTDLEAKLKEEEQQASPELDRKIDILAPEVSVKMQVMALRSETFRQLLDLLRPYLQDEGKRKAYLFRAFGTDTSDRLNLTWKQPTNTFIPELVKELLDFGEISPGQPALCAFLKVIREDVGVNIQARIDELLQQIQEELTDRQVNEEPMQSRREAKNLHCAVILTALPVEYKAVRAHLTNLQEKIHPEGTIYELGSFSSKGQLCHVGIVEIGAGSAEAAVETKRAIDYFTPNVVIFVGVAGGVKGVALGDVVAATKVYGYESGKVVEEAFLPRPNVSLVSYRLEQRARAEARKEDWLKRIGEPLPTPKPRVFIGAIAAGDKVVASTNSDVYQLLRSNYGDALAVEMESHGFLKALRANPEINALIVRGISDLIDGKSNADAAGYQEKAAQHASAFAFEILANLLRGNGKQIQEDLQHPEKKRSDNGWNQNKTWQCILTLVEHSDTVSSVAISPDGKILASGSLDKTIKLWDTVTGNSLATLVGHSSAVLSVAFSPDSKILASSSNLEVRDGCIKLWDLEPARLRQTLGGGLINLRVSSLAFSPDGQTLASGHAEAKIRLWQLNSGKLRQTLKGHGWDVNSLAFSRDGRFLVSGGLDGAIKIWNWRTGEEVRTLKRPSSSEWIGSLVSWFDSSVGSIWSVAVSPDGKTFACAGSQQPIELWELETGKLLRILTEHSGTVYSVAFSSDGKTLASGGEDNTIKLWNVETGELLQTLEHLGPVKSVAFSPNGQTLVSGSADTTIKVWLHG